MLANLEKYFIRVCENFSKYPRIQYPFLKSLLKLKGKPNIKKSKLIIELMFISKHILQPKSDAYLLQQSSKARTVWHIEDEQIVRKMSCGLALQRKILNILNTFLLRIKYFLNKDKSISNFKLSLIFLKRI